MSNEQSLSVSPMPFAVSRCCARGRAHSVRICFHAKTHFQTGSKSHPGEGRLKPGKIFRANRPYSWLPIVRMNIQVAVLCDAATDDNGKLNLLGAFDTIYARELPAIHPQCAVALRVTFASEDEGKRQLKLNFVDADGRAIMPPIEIPIEVTLPGDMHFGTRNYILNIQQLKFYQPGLYSLDVMFDEKVQTNIPLLVRHIVPAPA